MLRLAPYGLLAVFGALPPGHAAGPQHDVFQRPKPAVLKQAETESVKAKAPVAPVEWKPELKAIIKGDGNAWVNVEGRILQVGQDMDGFRLVDVQERHAVFMKDEVRYTLELRDVRGVSRASSSAGGVKGLAETAPASSSKGEGDPAPVSGAKVVTDPVSPGGLKASAILPKREAPRSDVAEASSR